MNKLTKLALIGSLFTALASPALAAGAGAESNNAPSTVCPLVGTCGFNDLKPYDNGRGQAAFYYCPPTAELTRFTMENHGVLIPGFNPDNGVLEGDVSVLKEHSFAVYQDPKNRFRIPSVMIVDQNKKPFACYPGNGNLPPLTGPLGF